MQRPVVVNLRQSVGCTCTHTRVLRNMHRRGAHTHTLACVGSSGNEQSTMPVTTVILCSNLQTRR